MPDLRLATRLYDPGRPGRLPSLIVGHGAGSRGLHHEAFCLEACRRGFLVLAVDFRGHGDSTGGADGPLELDIVAAADHLRTLPNADPGRICYRGSSMGGFYGLKAAPRAGLAAMALLCPASEATMLALLDDPGPADPGDTERTFGESRAPGAEALTRWDLPAMKTYFAAADSLALAHAVRCPVLLIHARGDRQVPLSHSFRLAAALPATTTMLALEGGDHSFAQHDRPTTRYTVSWLLEHAGRR